MKTLLIALTCSLAASLWGAQLGDPAAPLKISDWIKGEPVQASPKSNEIRVIEFWATWCPPCRASIPHLTELQKKFKDQHVQFIGISDESASTVKSFVTKMGDKMEYIVAVDDDHQTGASYMDAYGIDGIPHAFLVDQQNRVIWHGHPMGDLEPALKAVIEGAYDLPKEQKRARGQALFDEFLSLASSGDNPARADELAKQLTVIDKEVGGLFPGERFDPVEARRAARFDALVEQYHEMLHDGDASKEQNLAEQIKTVAPKDFNFEEFKTDMTFHLAYGKYLHETSSGNDKKRISELANELRKTKCRNASALNDVAWDLLSNEQIQSRDLGLALHVAKLANEAAQGKDANILDTYARALFDSGKIREAVRVQQKAVDTSSEEEEKAELAKTLQKYQKQL